MVVVITIEDMIRIISWMSRFDKPRSIIMNSLPQALEDAFQQGALYARGNEQASLDFTNLRIGDASFSGPEDLRQLALKGTEKIIKSLHLDLDQIADDGHFRTIDAQAVSNQSKGLYHQLIHDEKRGRGIYARGPVRDTALALSSLEKLAIVMEGKEANPTYYNFRTYLIVPIANVLLRRGDYEKVIRLLEGYRQSELLQRGVKAVIYDQPELLKGVELMMGGAYNPNLYCAKMMVLLLV